MTTKRKLWSVTRITHPEYPHFTVRIGEYVPSGTLHVFWWEGGRQKSRALKCRRADLGRTTVQQVKEAKRLGSEYIKEKANAPSVRTTSKAGLTLGQLADRYEADGFAGRTPGYKRDAVASIRRIATFLGADKALSDLWPTDVQKYVAHRLADGVTAAARGDVVALKIACNWAVEIQGLLEVSPFARPGFKKVLPKKARQRRPVAKKDRYEKLKAVATRFAPAFGVLLDLAWHTGHRIGALRTLQWKDVSLEQTDDAPCGSIRWYSDVRGDNKKHEHVVAMNEQAQAALRRWQKQCGGIGQQWVFPAPTDDTVPLGYHVAKKWLRQAETRAKVGHEKQGGWHMLRRGWATARKHLPIQDVAAAGGWLDTATPAQIYQQADDEMTLKVGTHVA